MRTVGLSEAQGGLNEAQARIEVARRNINNLRYADDTTLMAEKKPLDESERRG